MRFSRSLALVLTSCFAVTACDKDDSDDDMENMDDDGMQNETVDYAADIQPIWDANCIACHGGAGMAKSLLQLDGDSKSNLVNVDASVSDLRLVEPTSADDSYLVHKLRGTQGDVGGGGNQMPPGGSLSESDIALVENWINQGAK